MARFAFCCLLGLLSVSTVRAAVITITQQNTPNTTYDLSTLGSLDWAIWNEKTTSAAFSGPYAPLNSKLGASLISDMSTYNGGLLRGTTSLTTVPLYDFSYTNGTAPSTGSLNDPVGIFNNVTGTAGVTADAGVQVTLTAPSADPFLVYVWGTAFGSQVNLTATIGAATQSNTSYSTSAALRTPGSLYTLLVTPDSAGQMLTLNYFLESTAEAGSGHVSLAAVAVTTAIPEPSMVLLGALALPAVWFVRRRRSV